MTCRLPRAFKLADSDATGSRSNQENIAANKVQIAANREKIDSNEQEIQDVSKRFSDLTEFDTKGEATVFFASGSKSISAKDQAALMDLAHNAATSPDIWSR